MLNNYILFFESKTSDIFCRFIFRAIISIIYINLIIYISSFIFIHKYRKIETYSTMDSHEEARRRSSEHYVAIEMRERGCIARINVTGRRGPLSRLSK